MLYAADATDTADTADSTADANVNHSLAYNCKIDVRNNGIFQSSTRISLIQKDHSIDASKSVQVDGTYFTIISTAMSNNGFITVMVSVSDAPDLATSSNASYAVRYLTEAELALNGETYKLLGHINVHSLNDKKIYNFNCQGYAVQL